MFLYFLAFGKSKLYLEIFLKIINISKNVVINFKIDKTVLNFLTSFEKIKKEIRHAGTYVLF